MPNPVIPAASHVSEICRPGATDGIDRGMRRQHRAHRLDAGRSDHRAWENLQSIGARFQRRKTFRRRQNAGPRRQFQRLGFPDDIGVEIGRDDDLSAGVGDVSDFLRCQDGARSDRRDRPERSSTVCRCSATAAASSAESRSSSARLRSSISQTGSASSGLIPRRMAMIFRLHAGFPRNLPICRFQPGQRDMGGIDDVR